MRPTSPILPKLRWYANYFDTLICIKPLFYFNIKITDALLILTNSITTALYAIYYNAIKMH